jgi:Zn-dependent protease with chaperone function
MSAEHFAALICAWLLSYFAQSTLLLGVAWSVSRRLSSRYDREAEFVWRLALWLPVVSAIAFHVPVLHGNAPGESLPGYAPAPMAVGSVPNIVWLTVAMVWLTAAALGLVHLGVLRYSLSAAIRRRFPISAQQRRALENLPGLGSTRVSVVDGLAVPLALTSEICLPRWIVETMPAAEYRAVVAHELAHVKRRDAVWRLLTALATRVFFFQPLNWTASRRLRELSECLCDADAIASTRTALPLACALEAVAVRTTDRLTLLSSVPAMEASDSFTLARVARILSSVGVDTGRRLSPAFIALTLAAGTIGVVLTPRLTLPAIAFQRYTIDAVDPAGRFTLTLDRGCVVDVTIAGHRLAPAQVEQRGMAVRISDTATATFSLRLTRDGGISWSPRKRGS